MRKHQIVTVEQQRQQGLRPSQPPTKYVAAEPRRDVIMPPAHYTHGIRSDVAPSATQTVEVRTSAVDRAKGYTIVLTPLALLMALTLLIVAVKFGAPLFSLGALLVFVLTFTAVWLIGWVLTLIATPEFVSLAESLQKWHVIRREQSERWNHYKRLNGGG